MRDQLRRLWYWLRAAIFTLLIHGGIVFLIVFGLFSTTEKIKVGGKPIQAIAVSQQQLDRKKQEKVEKLEQLENKRKQEEELKKQKIEEEQKKKEEEKKKKEVEERKKKQEEEKKEQELQKKKEQEERKLAEKKRIDEIKANCVELVQEEQESGKTNAQLDDICDPEREDLKKKLSDDRKQKQEQQTKEEERKKQEEQKKRKQEEERKKQEEEKKRKQAEDRKKKEEERRKIEERRKLEERARAEQALKAQLAAELEVQLAAQTKAEASDALSAAAGRIKAAIENNWRRPGTSQRGLKATIQLKVSRNGDVLKAKVISSSGDSFFDQSAEIAVQKASPLPIPTNPKYYEYLNEFNIEFNPDG